MTTWRLASVQRRRLLQLVVLLASAACWCPARWPVHVAADPAGFCLQAAHSLADGTEPSLAPGARRVPPAHPPLAAHDWPLDRRAAAAAPPEAARPASPAFRRCHAAAPIFRFWVLPNRTLLAHHDHSAAGDAAGGYAGYRRAFLEQLVLALYLYDGSFPTGVVLLVDFTDHPQLCDQDVPFLRYSVLNMTGIHQHQQQQHQQQQQSFNLTELLAPAWVTPAYAARVTSYTRGFTIPGPEAWRDLSLSAAQLQEFSRCMASTHPWAAKRPVVFWRGQATGCSRGWPLPPVPPAAPAAAAAAGAAAQPPHLLRNKRVQAALRLFPLGPSVGDVGITSLPALTPECLGGGHASSGGQLQRPRADGVQAAAQQQRQHSSGRRRHARRRHRRRRRAGDALPDAQDKSFLTWQLTQPVAAGQGSTADSSSSSADAPARRRLRAWPWAWRASRQQQQRQVGDGGGSAGSAGAVTSQHPAAAAASTGPHRPGYHALAAMLHREGVGLEGWAGAAATLSLDGYGPPFRLPQQLLLGSAVLAMASPYQAWLDWHLVPGVHYRRFAYDLSDLTQQVEATAASAVAEVHAAAGSGDGGGDGSAAAATTAVPPGGWLRDMADAAQRAVAPRVSLLGQLDAFAWSVSRFAEACGAACRPQQQQPGPDAAADGGGTWRLLALDVDVFQAAGVSSAQRLAVMRSLPANFARALRTSVAAAAAAAAAGGGNEG